MVDEKTTLFNFTAEGAMNRTEITSTYKKKAFVRFIPTNSVMAFFYPTCGNCGHIVNGKTSKCSKCGFTLDWQRQCMIKKPHWIFTVLRTTLASCCGYIAAIYFINR